MKIYINSLLTYLLFSMLSPSVAANEWFVRPIFGLSMMSDFSTNADNVQGNSGQAEVTADGGFNAGLGVGYFYNERFAVELSWEYRSNDTETALGNDVFDGGNYASNLFFLNGIYFVNSDSQFKPYLGVGLSWAQEIDIDLETNGQEYSYAGDGDLGYQVFAGISYDLSEKWSIQAEYRYGSISDIALTAESGSGRFPKIDYKTSTIQVGLMYRF